jgi:hypothetical protein
MIQKHIINNKETHVLTGLNMKHVMKPNKNNIYIIKPLVVSQPIIHNITNNIIPVSYTHLTLPTID